MSAVAYARMIDTYRSVRVFSPDGVELAFMVVVSSEPLAIALAARGFIVASPWADPSGTGVWVADVLTETEALQREANAALAAADAEHAKADTMARAAADHQAEWAPESEAAQRPVARADWQPATGMPVTVWSDAGDWIGVGTVTDSTRRPGAPTLYTIDGHDGVARWVRTIANIGPMAVHA